MADTTGKSEPGIAMLGSTGSGKSTFLCALEMALLQQDSNWLLYARDDASKMQLDEMSSALTSEGKFPLPTFGIDTFDWVSKREGGAHRADAVQYPDGPAERRDHHEADRLDR